MPIMSEQEQQPDMVYKTMPRVKAGSGSLQTPSAPQMPPPPKPPLPASPGYIPEALRPAAQNAMPAGVAPEILGAEQNSHKALKIILVTLVILLILGSAAAAYVFFVQKPALKRAAEQAAQEKQQAEEAAKKAAEEALKSQSKISDDWRLKYFNASACDNQANCGDDADPDQDGLSNYEEFTANTDPNNPDSDTDGLADGDELHLFNYNPTTITTTGNSKYPDNYQAKTKWNTNAKREFNDDELKQIAANIKTYGLHIPSTTTLDLALVNFYTNYGTANAAPSAEPGALDRDTQRSDTIKQIGFALLKYKDANSGKFPDVQDFASMISAVKPLLSAKAINTTDPKNAPPYVYGYQSVNSGADFKLSYYSETTNQAVVNDFKTITTLFNKDQSAQRDNQRLADLEQIAQALELFSNDANPTDSSKKTFPPQQTWKNDLLSQKYIQSIPVDPQTKQDYAYTVNSDFTDFALQAQLEAAPTGKKGYLCKSDGCGYY